MRTIIHIGMPKTGSTALQMALHVGRKRVAKAGILYPELTYTPHAHHLLAPLVQPSNQYQPKVKAVFGPDPEAVFAAADESFHTIEKAVRDTAPECLVLSSELFFGKTEPQLLADFGARLKRLSKDITVVAYVRDPVSHYSSFLLERTKRTIRLTAPTPRVYREPIESFEAALEARLVVRPFVRDVLEQGDAVADFCRHALDRELAEVGVQSRRSNITLHPEMAELLQAYSARRHGIKWTSGPDEWRIQRRLSALESYVERDIRPGLAPEIARYVEATSKDLLWLRERFGIVFPKVNYASVERGPVGRQPKIRSLRDAFVFDESYQSRVIAEMKRREPDLAELLDVDRTVGELKEAADRRREGSRGQPRH